MKVSVLVHEKTVLGHERIEVSDRSSGTREDGSHRKEILGQERVEVTG